jgi:two-component system nitrogen regulation response regulator NtrX
MERIVIMNPQTRVDARHIPLGGVRRGGAPAAPSAAAAAPAPDFYGSLQEFREAAERDFILKKLDETKGNVTRAAELLGLERSNLYRKMRALGIQAKES